MVTLAARQKIRWLGPLAIWAYPSPSGLRIQDARQAGQPALLRFDHDEFMEEYLSTLDNNPDRLRDWVAQPETWREPMPSGHARLR